MAKLVYLDKQINGGGGGGKEGALNTSNTTSKQFLIGAAEQTTSTARTGTNNKVYEENGQLNSTSLRINEAVSLVYDSTNKCLNFNFS